MNLRINDIILNGESEGKTINEIDHISMLLKKGLKDYASLFVPYSATLKLHGKS